MDEKKPESAASLKIRVFNEIVSSIGEIRENEERAGVLAAVSIILGLEKELPFSGGRTRIRRELERVEAKLQRTDLPEHATRRKAADELDAYYDAKLDDGGGAQ
jgi:hypothetical protein